MHKFRCKAHVLSHVRVIIGTYGAEGTPNAMNAACDYVEIVSGNKVPDKFAKAGFHATKSKFVDAPTCFNYFYK